MREIETERLETELAWEREGKKTETDRERGKNRENEGTSELVL